MHYTSAGLSSHCSACILHHASAGWSNHCAACTLHKHYAGLSSHCTTCTLHHTSAGLSSHCALCTFPHTSAGLCSLCADCTLRSPFIAPQPIPASLSTCKRALSSTLPPMNMAIFKHHASGASVTTTLSCFNLILGVGCIQPDASLDFQTWTCLLRPAPCTRHLL